MLLTFENIEKIYLYGDATWYTVLNCQYCARNSTIGCIQYLLRFLLFFYVWVAKKAVPLRQSPLCDWSKFFIKSNDFCCRTWPLAFGFGNKTNTFAAGCGDTKLWLAVGFGEHFLLPVTATQRPMLFSLTSLGWWLLVRRYWIFFQGQGFILFR